MLACALAALVATTGARAHGDPASHYLEAESLYPAFADRPSQTSELRLLGLLEAAERRGYPIKVALVAGAGDLTGDPGMLRRPQRYAQLVASELGDRLEAPVLVVTPHGLGVAGRLRSISASEARTLLRRVALPERARGDALASAALLAVRRLARGDGRPLPARVPPAQLLPAGTPAGRDDNGIDVWPAAALSVAVLVAALAAFELWHRASRRGPDRLADAGDTR